MLQAEPAPLDRMADSRNQFLQIVARARRHLVAQEWAEHQRPSQLLELSGRSENEDRQMLIHRMHMLRSSDRLLQCHAQHQGIDLKLAAG
ncbi:MAG: hypothetical protein P8014_00730 [Acidihalobacter sp.]